MPDGTWRAGTEGGSIPAEGAIWRGYFTCAKCILDLYLEQSGAAMICGQMHNEGWAFRGRNHEPVPLSKDAVRRVTRNWVEYGGIVIGTRAKDRNGSDLDPAQIPLDPNRAVFDVSFLKQVGEVLRSRSSKRSGRGIKLRDRIYPLSALVYCAHCDELAQRQHNPRLRTRLLGRAKTERRRGSCQHRNGIQCGCAARQKPAELVEGEFVRLCRHLALSEVALAELKHVSTALLGGSPEANGDSNAKRAAAIAKCQKRLEAAQHLYEDGELERDVYLKRKAVIEDELLHWQNYTSETMQMQVQLTLCVEALTRLVDLWESCSDEARQILAKGLFDEIVFDLDSERITNFKLKPWAQQFLLVRGYQCEAIGSNVPPAGIEPAPLPPEGNALSAELWGRQHGRNATLILVAICRRRKPLHWKTSANMR